MWGFSRPAVLILLALAVHVAGRVAAVCAPAKFDSYVYAVAACKFYDSNSTPADLVPDKPAGQAFLTGWCYAVFPGCPSRMTLIPVDSAFLIGGYGVFGWLACRLFGTTLAPVLVLLLVVGINAYNTLDSTVAGLNVNENYLLLPMIVAVHAHLTCNRPAKRGFWRGLGLGLALTIKQTAGGLLLVFIVHGLLQLARERRCADAFRSAAWTIVGMAVASMPLVIALASRGWLLSHLHDLALYSGRYTGASSFSAPAWFKMVPLLAVCWWYLLGMVAWLAGKGTSSSGSASRLASRLDFSGLVSFSMLWLACEIAIVWSLSRSSAHYYQQIVAPAVLACGLGMAGLGKMTAGLSIREAFRVRRWAWVATAVLVLVSVMPMAAQTRIRARTFDYQTEIGEFNRWLHTWTPRSLVN